MSCGDSAAAVASRRALPDDVGILERARRKDRAECSSAGVVQLDRLVEEIEQQPAADGIHVRREIELLLIVARADQSHLQPRRLHDARCELHHALVSGERFLRRETASRYGLNAAATPALPFAFSRSMVWPNASTSINCSNQKKPPRMGKNVGSIFLSRGLRFPFDAKERSGIRRRRAAREDRPPAADSDAAAAR